MEIPLAMRRAKTRTLPLHLCMAVLSTAAAVYDPHYIFHVLFVPLSAYELATLCDVLLLLSVSQYIWLKRTPARVHLTPDGIRLPNDEFRSWDEIEAVGETLWPSAGSVCLRRKGEMRGYSIQWMYVGAGASELSDLIEHYKLHPSERAGLETAVYPYEAAC